MEPLGKHTQKSTKQKYKLPITLPPECKKHFSVVLLDLYIYELAFVYLLLGLFIANGYQIVDCFIAYFLKI